MNEGKSGSGGLCVVPSAKPQLARLQESGLEARGEGRDVDPIDIGPQTHAEATHYYSINVNIKTRTSSKMPRHSLC